MNDPLEGARVAVLGYGNQGVAHAHNLRAAGLTVVVGARPGRPGEARARADGFETLPPIDAVRGARVVALLVPDEALPATWPELRPALPDHAGVVLAHGFDLFGEQVVLCGGMNALTRAAFETLVEAGYSPEVAYLECVHQLRYLAELL